MSQVKTKSAMKKREMLFFWALVAFPLLQFFIFYIVVNFNSFFLAFQVYDVKTNSFEFAGGEAFLRFFKELISGSMMHKMIGNSLTAYLVGLFISLPLNLIFSFFIYKKVPMSGFFRIILFLPQIISTFMISIMFQYFLGQGIPSLLKEFGIEKFPGLLIDPKYSFKTVLFYNVWCGFGVQIIIYSSAMSRIPDVLTEVAQLDGISRMKEFFYITLPLIFPTITTFLISGIAGFFTNQMHLFDFYAGGARPEMATLGYYFFTMVLGSESVAYPSYPYASAAGLVFTFIAAPLTFLVKWGLEKITPVTEY